MIMVRHLHQVGVREKVGEDNTFYMLNKLKDEFSNLYIEHLEFSAHESLLAKELEENIAQAVNKLPAECRKIFELSRVEGLKYREIADTLHISVKTVEAQMSKALKSLRLELSDYLTFLIIALISSNL